MKKVLMKVLEYGCTKFMYHLFIALAIVATNYMFMFAYLNAVNYPFPIMLDFVPFIVIIFCLAGVISLYDFIMAISNISFNLGKKKVEQE